MITAERLAQIFLELQEQGAGNINLVTPTHYVLQIIEAIEQGRGYGGQPEMVGFYGGYYGDQSG